MIETAGFIVLGYLSGSILFGRIFAGLFKKPNIFEESKDKNPGTANAFMYGGFFCGLLTLLGDLAKGFLPVFVYCRYGSAFRSSSVITALVLAAPVIGHAFPAFFRFQGGKGIAVTFGCMLGIYPELRPVLIFAMMFILFSLVLRITPHFSRTIATYIAAFLIITALHCAPGISFGFGMISATVMLRFHMSKEVREKPEVKLLWMH